VIAGCKAVKTWMVRLLGCGEVAYSMEEM
jgi:hypothetical protein